MRFLFAVVAMLVLLAACSEPGGEGATTSAAAAPTTTTTPAATTTVPPGTPPTAPIALRLPPPLEEWGAGYVELDGRELYVAIADTMEKRRQGLMEIDDLLDLDGMLFVFDGDTSGGFWMKNTLIPLDIAYFDVDGRFVDGFVMEPCTADPCPIYTPDGDYRFALEMAAGTMPQNPLQLETGIR